jgi:hypothetical protein
VALDHGAPSRQDRNLGESGHSNASAKSPSPPEAVIGGSSEDCANQRFQEDEKKIIAKSLIAAANLHRERGTFGTLE